MHARRPNLLVISTDQQFAGAMSCAGNPHLRTPATDAIAARGVRFERAYCANPICVPSRASYMTGLFPHETGVLHNAEEFSAPMRGDCLARTFFEAGYRTGHVGKWHIPRPIEDRAWSGFEVISAARHNGVDRDIPAACDAFLRADDPRPFLLFASFVNPHDICEWARRASGAEEGLPNGELPASPPPPEACPPLPGNFAIPAGEPPVVRQHQATPGQARAYPVRHWGGPGDARWRQYLWTYYRLVELVDQGIARVLASLEASGRADDTSVVFFSDHGDGLGAHRWNQKTLFYEECSRVPFIVAPAAGRAVRDTVDHRTLVNLGTDLAPTLLDLAGLRRAVSPHGASLAPLATRTGPAAAREFIVSENNLQLGYGILGPVHGRMVRSARHKYVRYWPAETDADEQLFDLVADPGETRDLARDSGHREILLKHRRLLARHIRATGDIFPPTET